ncbi:MAG: hypothetical protein ACJ716_10360 [Marmoricola sp.]
MKLSRVALLVLPLAVLTACGSDPVPSAREAHTMACRGYVLTIGNTDATHAKELVDAGPDSTDGINSDEVLAKVRGAAASAGVTAGLSDDDFARFRTLVQVIDGLPGKVQDLDDGSRVLSAADLDALTRAVAAVHKLCY